MSDAEPDAHPQASAPRKAVLAIEAEAFRALGHQLIDQLASRMQPSGGIGAYKTADVVRTALGAHRNLPAHGQTAEVLIDEAMRLLFDHSPNTHHPRWLGHISPAPAPIGVLADLLTSALNLNVALWSAAPMASEIEAQTLRWLADMLGCTPGTGGLLTSGGSEANAMALSLALHAKLPQWREHGVPVRRVAVYASDQTHAWLGQAAEQAGLGRAAVRLIASDRTHRIDTAALRARIDTDRAAGVQPLMVVGQAGTVGTGAVDPLRELAALCRDEGLWWHVDGAYGAAAACLVGSRHEARLGEAAADLAALGQADSLAIDPHKWLYAPIEVGGLLVREPWRLEAAFGDEPAYYGDRAADEGTSFHRLGPQNTRGFRALKVWLALRMAGREGYADMLAGDVALAERLFARVRATPRLEALTRELSVTTWRYRPEGVHDAAALDTINRQLLRRLQREGRAHLSATQVNGCFALRACVVNFHTTTADVEALPALTVAAGDAIPR